MNLLVEFFSWAAGRIGDAVTPRKLREDDKPPLMPIDIMITDDIKKLQSYLGVTVDGFWGPKSTAAAQAHLRRLMSASPNKWPATDQASLTKFYGAAGDESQLVNLDVKDLDVRYEERKVNTIRCHRKVADSLRRVLESLAKTHPHLLQRYAGCFNDRAMRGGSTPSLHARGSAIDLDPDNNANKQHWPASATMPFAAMEAFAREGWLSAGAFWSRDAMHFQATQ